MHDLAHVQSEDCLAASLTKHSAKPDELIKAVPHGEPVQCRCTSAISYQVAEQGILG